MSEFNLSRLDLDAIEVDLEDFFMQDDRLFYIQVIAEGRSHGWHYALMNWFVERFSPELIIEPDGRDARLTSDALGRQVLTVHRALYHFPSPRHREWTLREDGPVSSANCVLLGGVHGLHSKALADLTLDAKKLVILTCHDPRQLPLDGHSDGRLAGRAPNILIAPELSLKRTEVPAGTRTIAFPVVRPDPEVSSMWFEPAAILPNFEARPVKDGWFGIFDRSKATEGPIGLVFAGGNDFDHCLYYGDVFLSSEREVPKDLRNRKIMIVSPKEKAENISAYNAATHAFVARTARY